MDKITVNKINESYAKIYTDPGIAQEISDEFTFLVPNAHFHPKVRRRQWDGKIRLFNVLNKELYLGLVPKLVKFARDRDYLIEFNYDDSSNEFSVVEAKEFIKTLDLPFEPHDHQLEAFIYAVRNNRTFLISPTASGKSLIIYLLTRYYNARTLIVVPNINLVHQLASDFSDYRIPVSIGIHKNYGGSTARTTEQITISTWQSLYKMDPSYFEQFDVVIGDEGHLFTAKSLITIMTSLTNAKYRFGTTGTLDGAKVHELVLEGLFGPIKKIVSTAELIEKNLIAPVQVKAIVLNHRDQDKKVLARADYKSEKDWIVGNERRNKFIKNLALSLEGNTFILFELVAKHGKILYEMFSDVKDRPVYFIHGGVEGEERDRIRKIVENETNAIIIASYGTMSTGANIKNLSNIIFASPSKSTIRILQSIGRALRKLGNKVATILDIADDLMHGQYVNHTLRHFRERVKIYASEDFPYKIYKVSLK